MNIKYKKFKCIEPNCDNDICYHNWKYGKGRCRSCANKGHRNPRFGKEAISKRLDVRIKISESLKGNSNSAGRILTEEHKRKIGESNKISLIGNIPWNKGLDKESDNRIPGGETHFNFGKFHSKETKNKMSENAPCRIGPKNPCWRNGRVSLSVRIRSLSEYEQWRTEVFKRDDYTCQDCGKSKCYVEAHHKILFAEILSKFLKVYDQFSPIDDKETLVRLAMKYKPFWEISNGQTLCKDCHNLTKGAKVE